MRKLTLPQPVVVLGGGGLTKGQEAGPGFWSCKYTVPKGMRVGMSMGELARLLPVSPDSDMGEIPSFPLATCSRQETHPGVMRIGELSLSLISCNTEESRPCTLLE